MMENKEIQKRGTAIKMWIGEALSLPYVKEEGWNANYLVRRGEKASRLNIIATIIQKPEDEPLLVVEDNSGQIRLRLFEDTGMFSRVDIGDVVQIVGKPREYQNERYIVPEIVRKVHPAWMEVRAKELGPIKEMLSAPVPPSPLTQSALPIGTESVEEDIAEGEDDRDRVLRFIKENDASDGVDTQEIIENCGASGASALLIQLLKVGDIFEVKPGRVKVLE